MSLLSYHRLMELINEGVINAKPEHVNATSIDLTLGNIVYIEGCEGESIDLAAKEAPEMVKVVIPKTGITLRPGMFLLAQTNEIFNLPNNISAEYKLNSSLARAGLDHLNAGWADAGWNGSVLTLEFKNCLQYQSLKLKPGMKCGQMVFFEHEPVPEHASYAAKGQYNGDREASQSKGLNLGDTHIERRMTSYWQGKRRPEWLQSLERFL